MTELSIIAREGRVRRALAKYDMILKKTPSRSWMRKVHAAGYMVVDDHNMVVSGAHSREYEDTIESVEYFAFNHLPTRGKPRGKTSMQAFAEAFEAGRIEARPARRAEGRAK
jgi:hypothetical protein